MADALEQLCGGSMSVIPAPALDLSMPLLPDEASLLDLSAPHFDDEPLS